MKQNQIEVAAAEPAVEGADFDLIRGDQTGFRHVSQMDSFHRTFVKHRIAEKRPERFGGNKPGDIDVKLQRFHGPSDFTK